MNYIAYFSFFKTKNDYQGHFGMLVKAKDPEEAVEKFERELLSFHESDESGALVGVDEIFLDSIIEISKFPDRPVITNFRELQTIETGIIGCDLINPTQHIRNYGWTPDDEEPDPEADTVTIKPFIKFEAE